MQAFKKAANKIDWHSADDLGASPHTIFDTLQGYLRREQAQQELAVGKRKAPQKVVESATIWCRSELLEPSNSKPSGKDLWQRQWLGYTVSVSCVLFAVKTSMLQIHWSFESSSDHQPIVDELMLSLIGELTSHNCSKMNDKRRRMHSSVRTLYLKSSWWECDEQSYCDRNIEGLFECSALLCEKLSLSRHHWQNGKHAGWLILDFAAFSPTALLLLSKVVLNEFWSSHRTDCNSI